MLGFGQNIGWWTVLMNMDDEHGWWTELPNMSDDLMYIMYWLRGAKYPIFMEICWVLGSEVSWYTILMNIGDEHNWWTWVMYSGLLSISLDKLKFKVWLKSVGFWPKYRLMNSFDEHGWWTGRWTWLMNSCVFSYVFGKLMFQVWLKLVKFWLS